LELAVRTGAIRRRPTAAPVRCGCKSKRLAVRAPKSHWKISSPRDAAWTPSWRRSRFGGRSCSPDAELPGSAPSAPTSAPPRVVGEGFTQRRCCTKSRAANYRFVYAPPQRGPVAASDLLGQQTRSNPAGFQRCARAVGTTSTAATVICPEGLDQLRGGEIADLCAQPARRPAQSARAQLAGAGRAVRQCSLRLKATPSETKGINFYRSVTINLL
jgi:hypothetical protein